MFFGKTNFISDNGLIISKTNFQFPAPLKTATQLNGWKLGVTYREKEVTYYNETAVIRIRANSSPETFSVSLSN